MDKYVCVDIDKCFIQLELYKVYDVNLDCSIPNYLYLNGKILLICRFISLNDYRELKLNNLLNG